MREELRRISPTPVEFFEASLETARFAETETEDPLSNYLAALYAESGIDLVVSVGGPAARFCMAHRDRLFKTTPLLMAGIEERMLARVPPQENSASVAVQLDVPATIDNILEVLPGTKHIAVVMGSSSLDRLWIEVLRRELEPFEKKVRFIWLHELSLEEMERKVQNLPPDTAIFYGLLAVDGAGVPLEHDEALVRLHATANAPIFGLFDIQLGRGIVGGPLLHIGEASREGAETALRLLNGEYAGSIDTEPLRMAGPVYDFRELERWGIPDSRLSPGSTVSFRPVSWLEQNQGPVFVGASVLGLETLLIAGLLVQRRRRQLAEDEANALSRRLLTAHEDERSRLGRELHDDVSQRLVRLAIDAAHVEKRLETSPDGNLARNVREEATRLSKDVHALSYRLHPSVLHDLGLAEALKEECELYSRRESVPARFGAEGAPFDLPPEHSLCLLRIAQEALTNVARHARASRADVTLSRVNGGVRMEIRDDGVGFDPERKPEHPSLGHASMRERVRLACGTLAVISGPGRGTTVTAWVPARPTEPPTS